MKPAAPLKHLLLRVAAALAVCATFALAVDSALPPSLAPYFSPPSEYAGKMGTYRSPLLFADGTPVKTLADWQRRRKEIPAEWHRLMGPWPPQIRKPKIEEVETVERENLIQRKVRLEIAPGQMELAYLLMPHGTGPFPAVLVPYYDPETSAGLKKDRLRDFCQARLRHPFHRLSRRRCSKACDRQRNLAAPLVSRLRRGQLLQRAGVAPAG